MRLSLSVFVAAFVASAYAVDPLVIETPTDARQCEISIVEWTGGVAPFELTRKFDGISETVQNIEDHFNSWNNHLPSGTAVTLEVEDAIGDKATSGTFTIQPSTQTGCL